MNIQHLKSGTIIKSPTQEYKIVKVLGSGSFGITYLATSKVKYGNLDFNVKFAIKEYFKDTCFRENDGITVSCTPTSKKEVTSSRQDFINEARRIQGLCHLSKNIVKVNECFEANGTAYYVMEYLNGDTPKQMSERAAIQVIREVANAVQIIHNHKFLHLDIKPDNIVFKNDDQGNTYPVLIDFGISKHFDSNGNPTSSWNTKGISEGYAPIEQYDEIKEFSPTLDIYALGATLLFLITGKNPPSSIKLTDPLQRELKRLIPTIVSQSTNNAILRSMHPNKNDRTQTVESFLMDLSLETTSNRTVADEVTKKQKVDTTIINKKKSSNNSNETIKEKPHVTNTKYIKSKKSIFTIPLSKNKQNKFCGHISIYEGSYYALFISFILSLASLWFYIPSLFIEVMWCLLGLVGYFILCCFLFIKANLDLTKWLMPGLIVLSLICNSIGKYTFYIVLAEIPLLLIIIFSMFSDKSIIRWTLSIVFFGITLFLGLLYINQI